MIQRTQGISNLSMPLVILTGPDGAGKSTQAELLVRYLRSKNLKARRSWIRALHSYSLFLSKALIRLGFFRVVSNPYGASYKVMDLKKIWILRKLWPLIEIFSMVPIIAERVSLPLLFGSYVVSERFTIDSIASIEWLIEDPHFPQSRYARILLGFIPKSACLVNLDCDYETISKRRGRTTEPRRFIELQRELNSKLKRSLHMKTIDTSNQAADQTQLKIQEYVTNKFG